MLRALSGVAAFSLLLGLSTQAAPKNNEPPNHGRIPANGDGSHYCTLEQPGGGTDLVFTNSDGSTAFKTSQTCFDVADDSHGNSYKMAVALSFVQEEANHHFVCGPGYCRGPNDVRISIQFYDKQSPALPFARVDVEDYLRVCQSPQNENLSGKKDLSVPWKGRIDSHATIYYEWYKQTKC